MKKVEEEPLSKNDSSPCNEQYDLKESHIPPSENLLPMPNFPVQDSESTLSKNLSEPKPASVQPLLTNVSSLNVDNTYYNNTNVSFSQSQSDKKIQQTPSTPIQVKVQVPRINEVIGTPNFYFLQDSELDSPEAANLVQPVIPHITAAANAPIPSQTFTNQSFSASPVTSSQVILELLSLNRFISFHMRES